MWSCIGISFPCEPRRDLRSSCLLVADQSERILRRDFVTNISGRCIVAGVDIFRHMPYRCHCCPLSVNYGAPQAIRGVSMFDFHHDWKAWSDNERTTVAAFAVGLALIVAAWMVV